MYICVYVCILIPKNDNYDHYDNDDDDDKYHNDFIRR